MEALEAAASPITPKRLLVVEDDDAVAGLYMRVFRRDYALERARNGEEAVGLLENRSFDAIVSDLTMPGMSGTELLKSMRERNREIPIVIVTGQPEMESAMTAVECRAVRYLVKPVQLAELKKSVASAIASNELDEDEDAGRTSRWCKSDLKLALSSLYMVYQPIIEPLAGSIYGFEALVRTEHEALSQPKDLLAGAEAMGAMKELGRAVRRAVASTIGALPGHPLLFVNLHASELLDEELYSDANPLRAQSERIVFELTEQAQLTGADERIRTLRSMGFRIAVDDLGAGYAALTQLVSFEPDFAKIDRNLVKDIDRLHSKRTLVASLNAAGRDMGIQLICEGVETEPEGSCLLDLGVQLLQGFYFARPARSFESRDLDLLRKKLQPFLESETPGS